GGAPRRPQGARGDAGGARVARGSAGGHLARPARGGQPVVDLGAAGVAGDDGGASAAPGELRPAACHGAGFLLRAGAAPVVSGPPLPPHELRVLVGTTDEAHYDNPTGEPLWGLPREAFDLVLDWGCGCGRLARKLLLQREPPRRYLGVDLHRGMVRWCSEHLAPLAPGFEFVHQDVRNVGLNPRGGA